MKRNLFEAGEEKEEGGGKIRLTLNEEYAKKFEEKKKKEELALLEAKYERAAIPGDDDADEEEDEEDEEAEDEDAMLDTKEWQQSFLRVMPMLKSKNPKLYDSETRFFEAEAAKEEFKRAAGATTGGSEGGGEDDLVRVKEKTADEREKEEKDHEEWKRKRKSAPQSTEPGETPESGPEEVLMRYWKEDANLTEDDKFLRKYIWKRLWLEPDDEEDDEEKGPESRKTETREGEGEEVDGDDELDREDEFERKYNFRFEEPGAGDIVQHPRQVDDSERVDPKAGKRGAKKRERKERKEAEKAKKQEEIERMKVLQKERLAEMAKKIKAAAGVEALPIDDAELEEDFDPEKWSVQMQKMFGEEFYGKQETEKPTFEPDPFIDSTDPIGLPKDEAEKLAESAKKRKLEAEGANPALQSALESGSALVGKRLKKKMKKKLAKEGEEESEEAGGGGKDEEEEGGKKEEEEIDPVEAKKRFKEELEKYYSLDFEDLIGDLPCRFKYTQVDPDRSGISVEDVLLVKDEELKRVMPLRNLAPYIPKEKQVTSRPLKWFPWRKRKGATATAAASSKKRKRAMELVSKKKRMIASMSEKPRKQAKK